MKHITGVEEVKKRQEVQSNISNCLNQNKKEEYLQKQEITQINTILKSATKFTLLKQSGKNILPSGECYNSFENLIKFLYSIKIYVLDCGEMECLVREISEKKNKWVEKVFEEYPDLNNSIYDEAKKFLKIVFQL